MSAVLRRWTCLCPHGVERVVKHDILDFGGSNSIVAKGSVSFSGPALVAARLNVSSRAASRVLLELSAGDCTSLEQFDALYRSVPWSDFIAPTHTLGVEVQLPPGRTPLRSSLYAAQRGKDLIVDAVRAVRGERPSVQPRALAHYWVVAFWDGQRAAISLDTTGTPLHARGYRPAASRMALAPLRENLAAGMLSLAHADVRRAFHDPFCGTGTLAIEQAMRALRVPPNAKRAFACERWANSAAAVPLRQALAQAREHALAEQLPLTRASLPAPITCSDADSRTVTAARAAIAAAGLSDVIAAPAVADARRLPSGLPANAVICANPPHGRRLGTTHTVRALFADVGSGIRRALRDARVIMLVADDEDARAFGFGAPGRLWRLENGGEQTVLVRWDGGGSPA